MQRALGIALVRVSLLIVIAQRHTQCELVGTGKNLCSAYEFSNSFGINTHINYFDHTYGDFQLVKRKLSELGVHHVRDGAQIINHDYDSTMYGRWKDLSASGIHFNAVLDPRGSIKVVTAARLAEVMAGAPGALEMLEGPNELDISGTEDWTAVLRNYQAQIKQALLELDPKPAVPLIAPSLAFLGNTKLLGDVSSLTTYGNLHAYPAGQPPGSLFPDQMVRARESFGTLPVVITETGYHNAITDKTDQPAVSEEASAKYMPRLLLESFLHGVVRTYIYELLDEAADYDMKDNQLHWGLVRADGTNKPAFTSLANLMTILKDEPRASSRGVAVFSLAGDLQDIHQLVLKKHDGSTFLILWQEVPSYDLRAGRDVVVEPRSVTLRLSGIPNKVELFVPLRSSRAEQMLLKSKTVALSIPDHPLVVEIEP